MNLLIEILLLILGSLLLTYICNKNSILIHNVGETHQDYIKSKRTPLIGGIIFFLIFFIDYENLSFLHLFSFFVLLIGVLSDLRKATSVYLRLLIQLIVVVIFIYFYEVSLDVTRIHILDNYLKNYFIAVLFTTFCVLIIINGTNFIDGSNLLALGYFLILELAFINLNLDGLNFEGVLFSNNFLFVLLILISFNVVNKLYLGDGGSYLLGFIYSFKCISFYLSNLNVSPFFIIILLWYPAFEILFSILRKYNFNKSPIKPDSNHLHQLIYYLLLKKTSSNILKSNLVGIIINSFNLFIIYFALTDIYNTQFQILLLILSISVYVFAYVRLLKIKTRKYI